MVVLAVDPRLRGGVRCADDRFEGLADVDGGNVTGRLLGFDVFEVVHRRAIGEVLGVAVDDRLAASRFVAVFPWASPARMVRGTWFRATRLARDEGADVVALGHLANDRTTEIVLLRDRFDSINVLGADLVTHPLLGFGEQDFHGVHVRFPLVDAIQFDARSETALRDELRGRPPEPSRPEVARRFD